ncbi:hypothetical protein [Maricaulis sp.]|uniref:hypothetical protein n=1 Tax=Maricaulis sp. TaxID=1486257 RepID=UPI003A906391
MFQGEPDPNTPAAIRAIRVLPFALAAAVGTYFIFNGFGVGPDWAAVLAAIAGGWVQGRLMRH